MKLSNLISSFVVVFFLSGCVVNTPTPATQVTAVVSAPVTELICESTLTKNGVERSLGTAFIFDYGNHFTVMNLNNEISIVSPNLIVSKSNSAIGYDKLGLMYSKGLNKYSGFYGVFRNAGKDQQAITFDCR